MNKAELLTGHTTVQASAGSGKTHLLISRIVRLLLTGTEPGTILAITFTRKAANEMQTRLLERLYELATNDEQKLKAALDDLQLEINPATLKLSRGLYEKVLRSEHPVKTTTFHAFCQDLLRLFPIEADVPPGFDLLEKTALFYDQAWQALMVEASRVKDAPLSAALHLLFSELGLFNCKQALSNFITHRSDWWAYTWGESDPVSYAIEKLQLQLAIDSTMNPIDSLFNEFNEKKITPHLNEFHVLLNQHATATNLKTSENIDKVIDKNLDQTIRFNLFKKCFLTQDGMPQKRKASKSQEQKMGAEGQQRFLELHTLLSEQLIKTNQDLAALRTLSTSSAWYWAGHHYLRYFQKLKKEQRLLDFTDLEWQTYLLLNQSNNSLWIQYKLDQRIDHLLVDEFQDTNPTQWRLILPLLEELAASQNERQRSVFIVGDEKQSIYRFRRAEPRLFVAAKKWLSQHLNASTCSLSHSWRSGPAIIEFVNQLFTDETFKNLLPGFIQHDTHRKDLYGKVTLLALSLKVNESDDNKIGADENNLNVPLRNPLTEPRAESTDRRYFNEGVLIAAQINSLIQQQTPISNKDPVSAINYNDIIILLRSRTHVGDYERALRQYGIPYLGAARGTLLDSLEVNDMLDLLQWLILPFDNLSLAGILRSPLFDVSNDDLIAINLAGKGSWFERLADLIQQSAGQAEHTSLSRAYKLLSEWQKDAARLPVHDLLDKIYSEANVLARYRSAFPQHMGHRVTANLNRLLELALEMDSGRYPSLSRFSAWINELRQLGNEAPDEPVTQGAVNRVRILTVHSAKGLEAPVVFLADSASSPANKRAYSTLLDWPAEKQRPDYFLLTGAKKNLDVFSQQCIEQQTFFENREDANLLYVAVTRAKQLLFISGSEPQAQDYGWYGKISQAFELKINENKEAIILTESGKQLALSQTEKDSAENILPQEASNKIPNSLSLPITISKKQLQISPSHYPEKQKSVFQQHLEADADNTERGIIMHQMLDYSTRYPEKRLAEFQNSEFYRSSYTSTAANDNLTSAMGNWWYECQSLIQSETFKTYFNPAYYDVAYNEVPIQFNDNDDMVYGFIDRLLLKDKSAVIIDYKTHPYATKDNIRSIAFDYTKQMQLYQQGVELLWPEYSVKSVLIFTAASEQYCFS